MPGLLQQRRDGVQISGRGNRDGPFGYKRWRWVTFLPPEEVRSGFSASAFSLLDDLERLPFSFSAESGESEEGLALFLKESGEERVGSLAPRGDALRNERFSRGDGRTGAIFILSPFGFLARLAVIDRMILEGKEEGKRKGTLEVFALPLWAAPPQ